MGSLCKFNLPIIFKGELVMSIRGMNFIYIAGAVVLILARLSAARSRHLFSS